jgi:hypothetical protein
MYISQFVKSNLRLHTEFTTTVRLTYHLSVPSQYRLLAHPMRTCPACNSQYSDDTLVFCLQDGTRLVGEAQRDTPTVVLGETETVARGIQFEPSQVTHVSPPRAPAKRSKTAIAVVLTALGMLLVFGVIGLASWILWLQPGPATANIDNRNTNGSERNANVVPTAPAMPTATPANTRVAPPMNVKIKKRGFGTRSRSLEEFSRIGRPEPAHERLRPDGGLLPPPGCERAVREGR